MHIFLDSNIFFNNWKLKNANFTLLFNYIYNEDATLLISELVVQETESNAIEELKEAIRGMGKTLQSFESISSEKINLDTSKLAQNYSFKDILEKKLPKERIEYFGYNEILQEDVVKRALLNKRPFRENEKGYRDTLIWLSLLLHLKKNEITGDIIFINNNSNDFFNGRKDALHENLLNDIEACGLKCNIRPYNALFDYVSKNIDKSSHSLPYDALYAFEDQLQVETERYFNRLSLDEIRPLVKQYGIDSSNILSATNHYLEIEEGMEDPFLESVKHIKGTLFYVSYKFWLRICSLSLSISKEEYHKNWGDLHIHHNLMSENETSVTLELYFKLDLTVSFIFDSDAKTIEGYSVEKYKIKY